MIYKPGKLTYWTPLVFKKIKSRYKEQRSLEKRGLSVQEKNPKGGFTSVREHERGMQKRCVRSYG